MQFSLREIHTFTKPYLDEIKEYIFDKTKIEHLLRIQNIDFSCPIDCNLGVDAASFSPISGEDIIIKWGFLEDKIDRNEKYSSIFVFYVEPVSTNCHSFPVHVIVKNDGFADDFILQTRAELIERLN